jgi:hypothetical protein
MLERDDYQEWSCETGVTWSKQVTLYSWYTYWRDRDWQHWMYIIVLMTRSRTTLMAKMGSLVPGHQGTGPRAFFYFILFFILAGALFYQQKIKKTLFSICFFSLSHFLSLFLCTYTLGSFEFNQFHQSKMWRKTKRCFFSYKLKEHTHVLTLSRSSRLE